MKYNKNYVIRKSISAGVPKPTEGIEGDLKICHVSGRYSLYAKTKTTWKLVSNLYDTDALGNISINDLPMPLNGIIEIDKNKIQISSKSGIAKAKADRLILNENTNITGSLKLDTIAAAGSDTDKFLVSDSNVIKYRTGDQVITDLNMELTDLSDVSIDINNDYYFTDADGDVIQITYNDHLAPTEQTRIQVRNDEGSTIPAGAPLYSKGEIGGSERILVGVCDANDSAKMPCIGIAYEEMNTTSTKDNYAVVSGIYNTNLSGYAGVNEGDTVYVSNTGGLTLTKPTGQTDLVQNVGIVIRANTPGGQIQGMLVSAIGRTNDIPNELVVNYIANATTDTDKFLVSDSGTVKYRTGAEILSDLGITADEIIDWTVDQGATNIHANNIEITHNQVTDFDSEVNALAQVKIDALVDSAPAALDTLNELAAALGDDANFATTVTNSLATKLPLAGGTMTGDLIIAADNKIKSDTSGSHNFIEFDDDSGSPENQTLISSITNVALIVDGNGNDVGQFEVLKAGTDSTTTELFRIENDGNAVFTGNATIANDLTVDTSTLKVDSSNNRVGIGVTDPDSRLEIVGAGNDNTTYGLTVKDSGNNSLFYIRDDGVVSVLGSYFFAQHSSGAYFTGSIKARGGITDDGGALGLGGNGNTDDMTISSGNVGIGTTSPSEMLHLKSTGDVKILLEADTDNVTETDNPEILFSQDGGGVTGVIGFTSDNDFKIANTYNNDTGDILLQTRSITRATIFGSGSTRFHNTTQFYNTFPQTKFSDDSGNDFVETGLSGNVFINKTSDADINFLWRDQSNNDLLSIDTGAQTVTIGETTQQTYKLKVGDNGRMNMPVRGLEFENGHGYWNAIGEFGLTYILMSTQNDLLRHRTPLTLERWNGSAWVDELSGTTSENNPTTNLQGLKYTLDGSRTTGWTLDDEWKKFRFVITREQAWAEEQLIYLELGWSSTNFNNGSSASGSMCPTMTVEQLDGSFDAVDDNNNDWTTNTTITSDWHTTGIASQYGTFFTFSTATHMPETHVRITVEFPAWDSSSGGSTRMNIRNLGMLSSYASDRTTEVWTTNWDRDAIGYGNVKIPAAHSYFINNVSVLNTNTLGSGVVNSSLTSVGTLTSLAVSGNTNIDGNLAIGDVNNAAVSLHIKEDSVNARIRVQSTGSNSTSYMRLENDAQNWDIRVDGGNSDKFIIRDETTSTNRFLMDTSGNIVTTGNMSPAGYLQLTGAPSDPGADGTVRLGEETNVLKIFSNYGWIRLGAESASWAHIRTDRSQFYFSTNIVVDGGYVSSYDEDLILRRDYNDTTYNQITIGDDTLDIKLDNTSRLAIDGNGQVDLTGDLVLRGEKGIFIENLGSPTGTSTSYGGSIIQPATAMYRTASNTHTGFIKIVIPTSTGANPRDMLTFWVDVFDYASGDSFSAYISGYNYEDAGSNEWHNCDAMILGTESHRDFTVRFCHDGTNPCITIGETDTTWNYLQVTVRNVQVGFTADIDDFKGDWTISVETTLPTYVDETVSGNFPIASRTIGTADVATTVTLTDQGSDSTCFPVFSTANTGDRDLHTDISNLTYDSTNGKLTSTTVSGTYLEATSKLNITTTSDAIATFKMTDDAWGYMEWRKNNNDRVAYLGMDSDMDRMLISATENGANEIEINTTTVDINADVDISGTLDMEENNINNVGEIALDKIKADTASNVNIMFNTSGMTFNVETGDSYQFNLGEVDADLVYYDDEENDLFKIDSGNKRVGIGLSTPTTTLDVEGTVSYKHVAVTASSDAVDVSGATVVECTPSGNISIGGFSGGVQGQVIHVLKVDSGFGRVFLEHNESTGTQKIFTSAATDIAIIQKGGVTLYCTGSEWIVLDK